MSKKCNFPKRVIFPLGQQQQFLLKAIKNLNLSGPSFAEKIGIHKRTLNDWKREKYSLPLNVVKRISKIAKVKIPENIKVKEPFWYVYKGAKIGGKLGAIACFKKYGRVGGDPEYRKRKWYEWWEREGRYKKHPFINTSLPIQKPKKSEGLAEFVGIVLGDGSITQRQVVISFNSLNEKEYFKFVANLIKKLFNVPIGIHKDKNFHELDLIISRSELVRFCTGKLGLKKGNKIKQQVDIPDWIKQNKNFLVACVRGLVDTDGCVFLHSYKVNNKIYSYKKLAFSNRLKSLIISVYCFLKKIGLSPRITKDEKDIRIESKSDMEKYFRIIGFHNPRHLMKYLK